MPGFETNKSVISHFKLTRTTLLRVIFLIVSVYISYICLNWISEKYFFHVLYEGKSLKYGYWPEGENHTEADFGERGEDIVYLRQLASGDLNIHKPQKYDLTNFKVSMISDSYGWGNGLKFQQSSSKQLEKRLIGYMPRAKVLSFSMGGDSLLDHAAKVDILEKKENISLYIFLIVSNDLMLRPTDNFYQSDQYTSIVSFCEKAHPNEVLARHPSWDVLGARKNTIVLEQHNLSFQSPVNSCIFEKSLENIVKMTKGKSIFIISDYRLQKDSQWQKIVEILKNQSVDFIDAASGIKLDKYKHCWTSEDQLKKCFRVTPYDGHPSALINEMYADLLVKKIQDDRLFTNFGQ